MAGGHHRVAICLNIDFEIEIETLDSEAEGGKPPQWAFLNMSNDSDLVLNNSII